MAQQLQALLRLLDIQDTKEQLWQCASMQACWRHAAAVSHRLAGEVLTGMQRHISNLALCVAGTLLLFAGCCGCR